MSIIEQIKALPKGKTVIHNLEVNALSSEFDHSELIALAESHERLLSFARSIQAGGMVLESDRKMIAEAEKL